MKKYTFLLSTVFLCCVYVLTSVSSYGQTTFLSYKTKGKSTYGVDIVFADESGNSSVQPTVYFNYSNVFFVLKPSSSSPKDFFREDDVNEIFSKIIIDQGGNKVNQSASPKILLNGDNKIGKVIIAFSKSGFENYNTFSFNVNGFFSEKIKIEEQYFQSFVPQNTIYDKSIAKVEAKNFLGAYADFMKIIDAANEMAEIKTFSFYESILSVQIPQIINLFIQSELEKFNVANEAFQKGKTLETLKNCEAIVELVSKNIENFNTYISMEGVNVSESKNQISSFLKTLTEKNTENITAFEQEKMLFFKQGDYKNYKFSLFIDLLSKMVLYKNSLSFIDKVGFIDFNLLKYFPESKKELIGDWEEQFRIYVDLINKNIELSGLIFRKEVMENLDGLSSTQKQPYFEIFSAFNSLDTDTDSFKDYLHTALKKTSDETIIENIEYWLLSFRLTDEGINSAFLTQLNEGINLIHKEQYDKADNIFSLLMRIANEYAPVWYYSGLIKHSLGESYSAERFFVKALEIYPEYIAPHIFILKIFEINENYSQLLEHSNTAIGTMNAWVFRYKRATAFYKLKKYNEAIAEINTECLKLNSWDLKQYFLLGDAYLALNDFNNAKKAYEKTLDINPFSSDSKSFDDRMKVLNERIKEPKKNVAADVIKEKVVVDPIVEKAEEIK